MNIRIWGCRGSVATPGSDTVRYGGNTACIEVRLDPDTLIVLDGGTGLRALGLHLEAEPVSTIHLLLTHLHIDHILGLGFFPPLEHPDVDMHVWGPGTSSSSLEEMLTRYLSPPLFPVELLEMCKQAQIHVSPEQWMIGDAVITAHPITHQGPTLAYRIEHRGRSLAYIPDHEPARGGDLLQRDPAWISGYGVARDVDVLFHDAQYTDEEYSGRVGWGHSSLSQAVTLARVSRVKQLVLFHHDPLRSDGAIDALRDVVRVQWPSAENPPLFAQEGMELDLSS